MYKKIFVVVALIAVLTAIVMGVQYNPKQRYYIDQMEKVSVYTGYENLGIIRGYNDRQEVLSALYKRAGIPSDYVVARFRVMDCDDYLTIWCMEVYESEQAKKQLKVKDYYLYGEVI